MAEERVAAHFAIGEDLRPGPLLQRNRLIDSMVFDAFEIGLSQLPGLVPFTRFLQPRRPQQTSHYIASEHAHSCLLSGSAQDIPGELGEQANWSRSLGKGSLL